MSNEKDDEKKRQQQRASRLKEVDVNVLELVGGGLDGATVKPVPIWARICCCFRNKTNRLASDQKRALKKLRREREFLEKKHNERELAEKEWKTYTRAEKIRFIVFTIFKVINV